MQTHGIHPAQESFWIELNLIDIPKHARSHTPDQLEELANGMAQNKQLQNIVVVPRGDRYEVIAGVGRVMAARKLGWQQIRAEVREGLSELDKVLIMIAENEEREDLNPIDQGMSYKLAIEAGKIDQKELARRKGKTEGYISQYLNIADLTLEVQENFRRLKLSTAHMTELVRLSDAADQISEAEYCVKMDLSSKELRARINARLAVSGQRAAGETGKNDPGQAGMQKWMKKMTGGGLQEFTLKWDKGMINLQGWYAPEVPLDLYLARLKERMEEKLKEQASPTRPASIASNDSAPVNN